MLSPSPSSMCHPSHSVKGIICPDLSMRDVTDGPEDTTVVDMAMEEVDLLVEGEDEVLYGFAIHFEITGVVRDHEVIGIEPTLHHPLAPEDFLLHSFKPGLYGSSTLGSLHIADVQHPITHLDSLTVLHHFPHIWVDDVVEEVVLGGA
ncbi:hypothetical protein D1007_28918 [Hordeum vulgare]|nr:hypothetical protein D1007_28918 [Hordeum vulgare]